ncbi:hypothetical protein F4782DRAFT_302769 [Xylaria castorea]|nr:hypothetical protein F4782DRAFT_302769 [Xylaria castorea]
MTGSQATMYTPRAVQSRMMTLAYMHLLLLHIARNVSAHWAHLAFQYACSRCRDGLVSHPDTRTDFTCEKQNFRAISAYIVEDAELSQSISSVPHMSYTHHPLIETTPQR